MWCVLVTWSGLTWNMFLTKYAQWMCRQIQKVSARWIQPFGGEIRKTLGWGISSPPPPPLPGIGLISCYAKLKQLGISELTFLLPGSCTHCPLAWTQAGKSPWLSSAAFLHSEKCLLQSKWSSVSHSNSSNKNDKNDQCMPNAYVHKYWSQYR